MNIGSVSLTSDDSICLADSESKVLASAVFEQQLRMLGLHEFPCGLGNWRVDDCKSRCNLKAGKIPRRMLPSLRDYGTEKETIDSLTDLVASKYSPWKVDYDWSSDVKSLREIAVKSPEKINEKLIFNHFRSLKIIDKRVTEVDSVMSKFKNLENLNLNANFLHSIDSRNLPKQLKTLELFGNQINDLSGLSLQVLPQLLHLGLGRNNIYSTDDYITGQYWSQLLSVDLGDNHLEDLVDMIDQLKTLPKLRNLILIGNPLCLVPAYRGYSIDRLEKLNCLDDVIVTTDEKFFYRGLADAKGDCLNTAKILLSVPFIKGLPVPPEVQYPEEQPEFPQVSRKYFVQFMFVDEKDQLVNSDDKHELKSDHEMMHSNTSVVNQQGDKASPCSMMKTHHSQVMKDVKPPDSDVISPSPGQLENSLDSDSPALFPIVTPLSEWMEEIELNWAEIVIRSKLLPLRSFVRNGMTIAVIEEKILSYPAPQEENADLPPNSRAGKEKKASEKQKHSSAEKFDDKKKKKKKELMTELIHCPPEYRTIASFQMTLNGFLDGIYECDKTFTKELIKKSPANSKSPSPERTGKKDKKDKIKGKQPTEKKQSPSGKGSATKDKKKFGKGKTGKGNALPSFDDDNSPSPLEMRVVVKLQHWKTAADALKSDEDFINSSQKK